MSTLAGSWGHDANGAPTEERPENWNGPYCTPPAFLKAMRQIEDEPEFEPLPLKEIA